MTLHRTVDVIQRAAIGTAIGVGAILLLVVLFRGTTFIKNLIAPPVIAPPNIEYGVLPQIQFPASTVTRTFSYSLNTLSGGLPEYPDRLVVFPVQIAEPNLLNLQKARKMVANIGIETTTGGAITEQNKGNATYEWDQQEGLQKKILLNIIHFDFSMTSNYLADQTVLSGQFLSNETAAVDATKTFLTAMGIFPSDIDLDRTKNPDTGLHFLTFPQLYGIQNGSLVRATSLSKAQLIRVDLYQNNLGYEILTGAQGDPHMIKKSSFSLPILYAHPPYSTMTFWVGSGTQAPTIVAADFFHQMIATPSASQLATYPIKTTQEAYNDLKNGKGYIASFTGTDSQIAIDTIYMGYYAGDNVQPYLMPIFVFEGNNGKFFAYVSAIQNRVIKETTSPTPSTQKLLTQ